MTSLFMKINGHFYQNGLAFEQGIYVTNIANGGSTFPAYTSETPLQGHAQLP